MKLRSNDHPGNIMKDIYQAVFLSLSFVPLKKLRKMIKKGILIFAISSMWMACKSPADEQKAAQQETEQQNPHDTGDLSIELNKGEKWKVDDNMMVIIREMEQEVNNFAAASQQDYPALAGKLQGQIEELTSNCTMKGKAHDELHKWLLPYIDLVNELSEAQSKDVAAGKFEAIQSSFKIFNKYFQ